MKLVAFRVQMYRCILDSGWVEVEALTVLVGKNESGKTSLLKALQKFNPFKQEPYVISREWPRGHRREQTPDQVVCTVRFRLSDDERTALGALTNQQMTAETVELTKDYAGRVEVLFPTELFPDALHPTDIDKLCADLPVAPTEISDGFAGAVSTCRAESLRMAHEGHFTELATIAESHKSILAGARLTTGQQPITNNENGFMSKYAAALQQIASRLADAPTIQRKAHDYVVSALPTFIYMDDYRMFQGMAFLDQVKQRFERNQATYEDRTLVTIFSLSGLNLEQEVQKSTASDREQRQYDLSDASDTLTRDIGDHWKQMPKYEVRFQADGYQFFTFVKGPKDRSLIRLEERSKGFQWFFSFDLLFMHESKGEFKNCVLLLDEPGLHLHPEGQKDLVTRLEGYSKDNTLIYSSHLPFMLNLRNPERIRVLSESDSGTIVTTDLTASQPEGKLTLQAALGISGSQSYLVAQRNLVVEGVDDYWIITELSNLFARSALPGLPDDVLITAAGGASEVAYVSTFMIGQELGVVALLDTDKAGEDAQDSLVKKWLTRYKGTPGQVLSLGAVVASPSPEFSIEDLFEESFYLLAVMEVYARKLAPLGVEQLTLTGADMLCKRVERALGTHGITFNKGSVAKVLRRRLRELKVVTELPPSTKERAERLLAGIVAALPPAPTA